VKNFASTLPPDEAERVFFWIDGFSIDEHQGFYGDKGEDNSEQWANTFKNAVQKMGNTVMVLAPWDNPVVLTRMWCLVRGASAAFVAAVAFVCIDSLSFYLRLGSAAVCACLPSTCRFVSV